MQEQKFFNMVNRFHGHIQEERLNEIQRLKSSVATKATVSNIPHYKEVLSVFKFALMFSSNETDLCEKVSYFYSLELGFYVDHIF